MRIAVWAACLAVACSVSVGKVSAQGSLIDRFMKADEDLQLDRIKYNKEQHYRCVLSATKAKAQKSKASDEAIVASAFQTCKKHEIELRSILESGAPTISGGRLALREPDLSRVMGVRKRELREAALAAIANAR